MLEKECHPISVLSSVLPGNLAAQRSITKKCIQRGVSTNSPLRLVGQCSLAVPSLPSALSFQEYPTDLWAQPVPDTRQVLSILPLLCLPAIQSEIQRSITRLAQPVVKNAATLSLCNAQRIQFGGSQTEEGDSPRVASSRFLRVSLRRQSAAFQKSKHVTNKALKNLYNSHRNLILQLCTIILRFADVRITEVRWKAFAIQTDLQKRRPTLRYMKSISSQSSCRWHKKNQPCHC